MNKLTPTLVWSDGQAVPTRAPRPRDSMARATLRRWLMSDLGRSMPWRAFSTYQHLWLSSAPGHTLTLSLPQYRARMGVTTKAHAQAIEILVACHLISVINLSGPTRSFVVEYLVHPWSEGVLYAGGRSSRSRR